MSERGYVQCAKDGQREFFDVPARGSWTFCGGCGGRLPIAEGMAEGIVSPVFPS